MFGLEEFQYHVLTNLILSNVMLGQFKHKLIHYNIPDPILKVGYIGSVVFFPQDFIRWLITMFPMMVVNWENFPPFSHKAKSILRILHG